MLTLTRTQTRKRTQSLTLTLTLALTLTRWNFQHRGLPFVTGEPPAYGGAGYALNVDPTHAPAPTDLECPLEALKPEGHRGPLLGVGFVD